MNTILTTIMLAPAALIATAAPAPLSPAAGQELAELDKHLATGLQPAVQERVSEELARAYAPEIAECRELIARYRQTGKVTETSARHHLTLLHLACLGRKLELVRALLAAGADPNALAGIPDDDNMVLRYGGLDREQWTDSPLVSAVHATLPGQPEADTATRIALIDMLVAAGADVTGKAGGHALLLCAAKDGSDAGAEQVALHLLKLGADPTRNYNREPGKTNYPLAAIVGWGRVQLLKALLDAGILRTDASYVHPFTGAPDSLLGIALWESLAFRDDEEGMETLAAGAATLIRHGADLHAAGYDGATPADFIHAMPRLLAKLEARGLAIPYTPRTLRAESLREDLAQLPHLAIPSPKQLAPHAEALTALLTLEPEAPDASKRCALALRFLYRLDAGRAAASVCALPLWRDKASWLSPTGAARLLANSLRDEIDTSLPTDWLREQAAWLDAQGYAREAHEFIHLMARQADALPVVEALCADPRPALASAAWSVRLQLAVGIDSLPLAWYRHAAFWQRDKAVAKRVKSLAWAVDSLCLPGSRPGHLFDPSRAMVNINSFEAGPGLVSTQSVFDDRRVFSWPREEAELVRSLREQGEPATADYVAELFRLRRESQAESLAPPPDDNTAPDEDYEETDDSALFEQARRAREQLRELWSPDTVLPHGFALEAAMGRLLWDLYQQLRHSQA